MHYPDPVHQALGHTSPETALFVDTYKLNGVPTPVRYWVETNLPYGQRIMRQLWNHHYKDWFKPKPLGKYAPLVLMFQDPTELTEADYRNGTNIREPIAYVEWTLSPQLVADEHIDNFMRHYEFDDYQHELLQAYKEARMRGEMPEPLRTTGKTGPMRGDANPELKAARLELELERLRAIRLRNDALELKLAKQRQKLGGEAPTQETIRAKGESEIEFIARKAQTDAVAKAERARALEQYEKDNNLILPPSKGYGANLDREHEESLRSHFCYVVQHCAQNPDYVPSDVRMFKTRAENLQMNVSHFPFFNQAKTTREVLAAGEKKVDLDALGATYHHEDEPD